MRILLTGYCLGIAVVSLFPVLDRSLLTSVLAVLLSGAVLNVRCQSRLLKCLLLGVTCGVVWHWLWAVQHLENRLLPEWEGRDLLVRGQVIGIPIASRQGQSFDFEIQQAELDGLRGSLRLSTFINEQQLKLRGGEVWQLRVRLKQVHGYSNPGGFDREANLFRRGVIATGYVRESADNALLSTNKVSIAFWRHALLTKLKQHLQEIGLGADQQGMMLALIVGERSQLSAADWSLFSATGTNHLFVISGLHIGLVAFLSFRFGSAVAVYLLALPFVNRRSYPAQTCSAMLACLLSIAYSLLAGWTLPTQRACVMVVVLLSSFISKRRLSLGLRYLLALSLVLSLDPLATTSAGFWLSFAAVAILLFFALPSAGTRSLPQSGFTDRCWQHYLRPQWIIFIGLLLPLSVWMGQVSLIAPVVNVIAIPLVGMLLVPVLLAATVCSFFADSLSGNLFAFSAGLLYWLRSLLAFMVTQTSGLGVLNLVPPQPWQMLLILPGILLLLLPFRTPYRWLAIALTTPLFNVAIDQIEAGQLRADVFDVGQGLAVLIRTVNYSLLFDTGPGNEDEWDAGEYIVLPALQALGVRKLSTVIVSHSDVDHAGGVASIRSAFPQAQVLAGESLPEIEAQACREGQSWKRDGAEFRILHPSAIGPDHNNNSCVLQIRFGPHGILLPGDIDAVAERQLAMRYGSELKSSVLLASHHGSSTSSSFPFLKMVEAEHVVFANGYRNSFGHPAPAVVLRNYLLGSELHETARTGMLSFSFDLGGQVPQLDRFRSQRRRYWSWSENPLPCRYC